MTEEQINRIDQELRTQILENKGWMTFGDTACRELIAEVRRLRQDLADYGQHEPRCEHFGRCVCGLEEALHGGAPVAAKRL